MKKFFTLAIAALALIATGCNPEGSEEGDANATASDLIGHWGITHEDGAEDLVFNTDGTVTSNFWGDGRWSVSGGVITIVSGEETYAFKASLLYDKTVLILRWDQPATDEEGHYIGTNNGEGEVYFFFRDGKAKANDIKDIQGKWYWYMQRDESFVRAAITINGDDADVIITVWGERYKGKATYKDGRLKVNKTSWYTSRYEDDDKVNECPDHPEDAAWLDITGNTGDYWISDIEIDWPFIANGSEAYCILANLSAVFTKK